MIPRVSGIAVKKSGLRPFGGDRTAGVAVLLALLFPAMIAMGLLAIDAVRAFSQATMVSYAAQSAALAASTSLGEYYSKGASSGTASIGARAALIGNANVTSSADLTRVIHQTQLGVWDWTHNTFTALASNGAIAPNAVQVTGRTTLSTFFGGSFGVPTLTIQKTATATLGTNRAFNVIVLNDMGGPNPNRNYGMPGSAQARWWAQQQAADLAILGCVNGMGNLASKFGVVGYVADVKVVQPLTTVHGKTDGLANVNMITHNIDASMYCRESRHPDQWDIPCHGSNVASGLYEAITEFNDPSYIGANNNIVILTNELPLYDPTAAGRGTPMIYTTDMGTDVRVGPGFGPDGVTLAGTARSTTPLCGNAPSLCSSTNLKQMAEAQSAVAGAPISGGRAGITISVLYFSGDAGTPPGKAAAYWNEIRSWTKNGGMALQTAALTATTDGVVAQASKMCQLMGVALQTVSQ